MSATFNDHTEVSSENKIDICQEHVQKYFTSGTNGHDLQEFNKEIFDDNCKLQEDHIKHLKHLISGCSKCEECLLSLPKQKIICLNCSSEENPPTSCDNCKKLVRLQKQIEVYKLFWKKLIIKKYSKSTIRHLFQKNNSFNSPKMILSILSGIGYNVKELNLLSQEISKYAPIFNDSAMNRIEIVKACALYHNTELETVSCKGLFIHLTKRQKSYPKEYILYLAMRFNLDFYRKISSKNLFELFKSIIALASKSFKMEYNLFISDIISKIDALNFIMDGEDFFKLIDLFIESTDNYNFLSRFFEKKEYFEMLTEEKVISIFEKIFKINSTALLNKNLKIFENKSKTTGTYFRSDINSQNVAILSNITSSNSSESNEVQNDILEAQEPISSSESSESLTDRSYSSESTNSSSEAITPRITNALLLYVKLIKFILKNYPEFTPNGTLKIACIIFSLLDSGKERQKDFKILLSIFYSKLNFSQLQLDDILVIINLHLKYGISYNFNGSKIDNLLDNIKPDEIDKIFDCVFNSQNKDIMLGIFAKYYDTKPISDSRFSKLAEYSADKFKILFLSILKQGNLSISFQIKYILEVINQSKKLSLGFFNSINKKIFTRFSRRDIDLLFKYCITHKKYKCIQKFVEYLNLEQLEQIPIQNLISFEKIFFGSIKKTDSNLQKYYETPFFFYILPSVITNLAILVQKDTFYMNSMFNSIINNPLFQSCIDINQKKMKVTNIFTNGYINKITDALVASDKLIFYVWKCFYDNLNSYNKINFKVKLVDSILFFINQKKLETDPMPNSRPDLAEVEKILQDCILIRSRSENEMVDFFFKYFNYPHFFMALKSPIAVTLEKIISDMDVSYLVGTYYKHKFGAQL